jgi:hypothetical protein
MEGDRQGAIGYRLSALMGEGEEEDAVAPEWSHREGMEAGGAGASERVAVEVFAPERSREECEHIGGATAPPGGAYVLEHHQAPIRLQDSSDLAKTDDRIGDLAEDQGLHHPVEGRIPEGQGRGITGDEGGCSCAGLLPGLLQHAYREIAGDDLRARRVEGEVSAGPRPDLETLASLRNGVEGAPAPA